MRNILEQARDYFEKQKQERIKVNEKYFREQEIKNVIENLDIEGLKSLLENGLNVADYEREHSSTILSALTDGFVGVMLKDLKKLNRKDSFNYFFGEFSSIEEENLPLEVQGLLGENVQRLLSMMKLLSENGADINFPVNVDGKTDTVFSNFIVYLNYFKSLDVIKFFLNDPKFDLNLNLKRDHEIMSALVHDDSNLSTAVLQELVSHGLPYSISQVFNANSLQDLDGVFVPDDLINPIIICLAFAGKTKKSKLDIIYPLAPVEQQERYAEAYKTLSEEEKKIQ